MTNAPVRIQRNGEWICPDIDELTDQELEDFARSCPERGWAWAIMLVRWIRNNVKEAPKS